MSEGRLDLPIVLLVDDEPDVLEAVGRQISRCGYRLLSAGSPSKALELAAAEPAPGLLVSDVMMPEMSGPDLYRRLQAQMPGLRVVYISGYTGSDLPYQDITSGGAVFLEKPFSSGQLAEAMRQAISRPPRTA